MDQGSTTDMLLHSEEINRSREPSYQATFVSIVSNRHQAVDPLRTQCVTQLDWQGQTTLRIQRQTGVERLENHEVTVARGSGEIEGQKGIT